MAMVPDFGICHRPHERRIAVAVEIIAVGAVTIIVEEHRVRHALADILERMTDTVFFNNNCNSANSYYFDRHGDAPFMRPMTYAEVWYHSHFFDLDDYRYTNSQVQEAGLLRGHAVAP